MIKKIYSSEQRQKIFGDFLLFKPDQVCDELHLRGYCMNLRELTDYIP